MRRGRGADQRGRRRGTEGKRMPAAATVTVTVTVDKSDGDKDGDNRSENGKRRDGNKSERPLPATLLH